MNHLFKRLILLFTGSIIMAFGLSLVLLSGLGMDPFISFNIGLEQTFGLTLGTWIMLVQIPIFLFIVWKRRSLIGIGMVITMLIGGYLLDGFNWLHANVFGFEILSFSSGNYLLPIILLLLGLAILGFGIPFHILANIGFGPYDTLGLVIEQLTNNKINIFWARMGTDVIAVIFAFLLGGKIGIATVVAAFCVGPFVNFFRSRLASPLLKWLGEA